MKFQNIIFDFDGTLVDSAPAILVAFSRVFEQFDLEPAIPLDASLIGPPLDDILIKLSGSAEPEVVGQLATAFKIVYDTTTCLETLAFDGVDAMLKKLKLAGLRLFVATNKRLLPTEKIISHIGWDKGIFEAIYAIDSFRPVKPNKSLLIAQLMNDFGLLTTDTVYVGDRYEDGLAAAENNIHFFCAAWGYDEVTGKLQNYQLAPSTLQLISFLSI